MFNDYFSSIFSMLNFHKKNEMQLSDKHYADFLCSTRVSYTFYQL